MAEHIDNVALLASGGHRWNWGRAEVTAKELRTIGTTGASRITTACGPRPVTITGVLKATGATQAACRATMDQMEQAIETLRLQGKQCAWQDDAGRTGDALVVTGFAWTDEESYDSTGTTHRLWRFYRLEARECKGRPAWLSGA